VSVVNNSFGGKWSIWWPEKEKEDRSSLRVEAEAAA